MFSQIRRFQNIINMVGMVSVLAACTGGDGDDSGGGGSGGASGTPTLTVSSPTVTEGDSGTTELTFAISLSEADPNNATEVDYATADGSAWMSDNDYVQIPTTRLTIPANELSTTITVTVNNDNDVEFDETLTLNFSNISSNASLGTTSATGTILNDDYPLMSISSPTVLEDGGTMEFTVSLDVAGIDDIAVDYVSDQITASAGEDYTQTNGVVNFSVGDPLAKTVQVAISGDDDVEPDETLRLSLNNLSGIVRFDDNGALDSIEGIGTIANDDLPKVSIGANPNTILETNSDQLMLFNVALSDPAEGPVTINYDLADVNSANFPLDFVGENGVDDPTGTVEIAAGNTSATVPVTVIGDQLPESVEFFEVRLTAVTSGNAELDPLSTAAIGNIQDDDTDVVPGDVVLTIFPASASESAGNISFTAQLSGPANEPVEFQYETFSNPVPSADEAEAGVDYTSVGLTSITIDPTIAMTATITIPVIDDSDDENDETFKLLISNVTATAALATPEVTGRIIDNEGSSATTIRVNISDASVTEGDSDSIMQFAVSLTDVPSAEVIINYTFPTPQDEPTVTASEGIDFSAAEGSITIAASDPDLTAYIQVPVIGDEDVEDTEIFYVDIEIDTTSAGLVEPGDMRALGRIFTDEPFAIVGLQSVNVSINEGNTADGTTPMNFTLTIENPPLNENIVLTYETSSDTANLNDTDYTEIAPSQLVISPNTTTATIAVNVIGDDVPELDETFALILSNLATNDGLSSNARFANGEVSLTATGSILNDEDAAGWSTPEAIMDGSEFRSLTIYDYHLGMSGVGHAVVSAFRYFWDGFLLDQAEFWARAYTSGSGGWRSEGLGGPRPLPILSNDWTISSGVIEPDGSAHLIFPNGNLSENVYIEATDSWAGTYNPGTDQWTGMSEVAPAPDPTQNLIYHVDSTQNDSGQAMVVWREDVTYTIGFNRFDSSNWATADVVNLVPADAGTQPKVSMDNNGHAIVVWRSGENLLVRRFDADLNDWDGDPMTIENLITDIDLNSVEIAMNDNIAVVIWVSDGLVWANRYDPNHGADPGWLDTPVQISLNQFRASKARVAIAANNVSVIAWNEERGLSQPRDILGQRLDSNLADVDSAGIVELENSDSDADIGNVAMDPAGNAIVIFSQKNGLFITNRLGQDVEGKDTRVNRYSMNDGVWCGAETIDSTADEITVFNTRIAMDNSGNAIAVWVQDTVDTFLSNPESLWSSRYSASVSPGCGL